MERWGYAQVRIDPDLRLRLTTTEPAVVDEVLEELRKLIPSTRVKHNDDYEKLGIRATAFEHLTGMHEAVCFWILAKLCERGWEPLGRGELRRRYGPEATHPTTH